MLVRELLTQQLTAPWLRCGMIVREILPAGPVVAPSGHSFLGCGAI